MLVGWCRTCGETFTPSDEEDTIHLEREDGTSCGGQGVIVGEFTTGEGMEQPSFPAATPMTVGQMHKFLTDLMVEEPNADLWPLAVIDLVLHERVGFISPRVYNSDGSGTGVVYLSFSAVVKNESAFLLDLVHFEEARDERRRAMGGGTHEQHV